MYTKEKSSVITIGVPMSMVGVYDSSTLREIVIQQSKHMVQLSKDKPAYVTITMRLEKALASDIRALAVRHNMSILEYTARLLVQYNRGL